MFFTARWKMALRFIASALVFESALSFGPVLQHQHVPAERGRLFSSPLKSSGSSAHPMSSSAVGASRLQVQRNGHRQRRRETRREQQPSSLVVMLAGGAEGVDVAASPGSRAAGGGVTPRESVGVSQAAGKAPSPRVEQQTSAPALAPAPAPAPAAPKEEEATQASRRRRQQQQHHHDSDFLFEQKLESVRAALLCGAVGAASRLLAVGAGVFVPGAFLRDLLATPEPAAASVLFGLAAGFAQGGLFGLTYRYVVRSDREAPNISSTPDPPTPIPQMDGFTVGHLGDGAVAAFALTSALGQSEVPLTLAAGEFAGVLGRGGGLVEALGAVLLPAAPFLPRVAGDLFLYSAARAALDRALDEGAIKPFP